MIKLVMFDLDGTLLDTIDDIGDSMNEVLRAHGYGEHTMEDYCRFVGDGPEKLIRRAVGVHLGTREFSEIYLEYRALYRERSMIKTKPYDGILALLSELRRRDVKTAILSNKPHDTTMKVVPHYFPEHPFDAVLGLRSGKKAKPEPEGAFEILNMLGVRNSECIYLGDTNVDMQTAKNADLIPVGVLWGFRSEEELRENGAKRLISKPEEVLPLLSEDFELFA